MKALIRFTFVLILFLANELNAQVQYGISYQAILRDASGNVLNGRAATIRINITNKTGSLYYYKETHSVTTNSYGLVTLVVGKGTPVQGTFAGIPWEEGGISMIVELKLSTVSSYTQFDIQELNSVPYAIHASNGIKSNSATKGQTAYFDGANWIANGEIVVTDSSVNIVPKANHNPEQPIFAVLNSNNEIVFAVYETGVRSYVGSDGSKKAKGGFAVGGLSGSKSSVEYLKITPDSTRIYIDNSLKGSKGGFAIGGLSGSKSSTNDFFKVTSDSTYFMNTVFSEKDMLVAGTVSTNVGISSTALTDIEGNMYKTIKIGTQVWMAENLKTTKYSSGALIPSTELDIYNGIFSADTLTKFGRLYSNLAVESPSNVCPDGWRLPNYADWQVLFSFVGGLQWMSNSQELFKKMAEPGLVGETSGFWNNNLFPSNTTGFSVRPGGEATQSASWMFYGMGDTGTFWTFETTNVVRFDGMSGYVDISEGGLPALHSVRCVKN